MIDAPTLQSLAEALDKAQKTGVPCAPLTATYPDLTIDEAYEVQRINISRRVNVGGLFGVATQPIGHKIGITSKAVQQWLNVAEPDFGRLLDDMVVANSGTADYTKLLQPRAEGEIAFVLKSEIAGATPSIQDVKDAIDFVLPAIEIVDSRVADWKITIADTIADNASSGMFVLGTHPVGLDSFDLRTVGMTLRKNSEVVSTGAGAACLGNPLNAVQWLARKFHEYGMPLQAGDVILSGALGPVTPVVPGDTLLLRIGNMEELTVGF